MKRSRNSATLAGAAALATLLAWTDSTAMAQVAPAARDDARDLAIRGRAAFDRGDLDVGCPLLEQAYGLDGELLGAGFALAECHERNGRFASAHRLFLEVAHRARARGEARADEARARAVALLRRCSMLVVDVTTEAARRPELTVELDGRRWERSAWSLPEPVDGGSHTVVARAPGLPDWSTSIVVPPEGGMIRVDVPFDRTSPQRSEAPPPPAARPLPWKTAGIVAAGLGVAAIGTSVAVGVVARGDYDSVDDACDANDACTPAAAATREDARDLAGVGTALFVGGAILATAGVTVFLLAPEDSSTAVRLAPGSMTIAGRF